MRNFTFRRAFAHTPIILLVLFSSVTFGQIKKPNFTAVNIKFQVDMSLQYAKGAFNPLLDFMDITGTMNGWAGSEHLSAIGAFVYEITYPVEAGSIQEYKFRINGSNTTSEFPGGPNRMYLVPSQADSVRNIYTDYDPGTVPMTFKCHMEYQIKMGRFNKSSDYLDIAGTMNNFGAYDVLFDRGNDSIYVININMDTLYYFNQTPIEFKFRINGDWNTSEFPFGGPNRLGRVQDTLDGFVNLVDVWYNDQNPNVPAPPFVYNVAIQGNLSVGETLTGAYTYEDVNGDTEGSSTYSWLRADSTNQITPETISGATAVNYTVVSADAGKYLAFSVAPVDVNGEPGNIVIKWSDHKVYGVGINESNRKSATFYPNPVSDLLTIENLINTERIEIFSLVGQKVYSISDIKSGKINVSTNSLEAGVYFIKLFGSEGGVSTMKFIKY